MKLPQDIQNTLTTSLGMDDNNCCRRHPNQVICIPAARPSKFRRIVTSCRICTSESQAGKCCRQRRSLVPVIADLQKLQSNDQEWNKRTSILYHWNSALRLISEDEDESSISETTEEEEDAVTTSEPIISDDEWKEQVQQRIHQVRHWENYETEKAKARRDEIWSKYYKLKSAIDHVRATFANKDSTTDPKTNVNDANIKDSSLLKSFDEDNILQGLFKALRRTSSTKKQRSSSSKSMAKTEDKKKKTRKMRRKKKRASQEKSSTTKTLSTTTTRRRRKNRRSKRKSNLDKTFLRSTFQQRVKKLIIINRFFQKIAMKALMAEIQMDIRSYKRNNPKESTAKQKMVHWDDGGGDLVLSVMEFEKNLESLKRDLFYTNEEIKLFRFEKFMEDHADEFEIIEDDDDDYDDENDSDYEEDEYEVEIIEENDYDEDEYEEYIEEEYDEFDAVILEEIIETKPFSPIAAISA